MVETELADRDCVAPDEDDDPLTSAEIEEVYAEIDDEVWTVIDDHHLEGTYELEDFRDALEFTNEVGELAEDAFHHPDIHLSWGEVGIEIWSHEIDGLSEIDFVMAARMDRMHDDYE